MSEIEQKKANIKSKMEGLDSSSMMYQWYGTILRELDKQGGPVLKIHQTPEICDSCQ